MHARLEWRAMPDCPSSKTVFHHVSRGVPVLYSMQKLHKIENAIQYQIL